MFTTRLPLLELDAPRAYRLLVTIVTLLARSGHGKDLYSVVLRHQLTILRRQVDRPP